MQSPIDRYRTVTTVAAWMFLAATCLMVFGASARRAQPLMASAHAAQLDLVRVPPQRRPLATQHRQTDDDDDAATGPPSDRRADIARRNLKRANAARAGWVSLRADVRTGDAPLRRALVHRHAQNRSVLELLGLAVIGLGLVPARQVGRIALDVARGMTFQIDHFTRVGDLGDAQKVALLYEFERQASMLARRRLAASGDAPTISNAAV